MVEGRTREGFATVKSLMYADPRTFRELLGRIAQATISYLQAQIQAGAAAVQLFDTWCGELNLRDYLDFALPAVQEIVSGLGKSVPVIYYTKGFQSFVARRGGFGRGRFERGLACGSARVAKDSGPKIALQGMSTGGVVCAGVDHSPRNAGDRCGLVWRGSTF